jgi:hypothetical protein
MVVDTIVATTVVDTIVATTVVDTITVTEAEDTEAAVLAAMVTTLEAATVAMAVAGIIGKMPLGLSS